MSIPILESPSDENIMPRTKKNSNDDRVGRRPPPLECGSIPSSSSSSSPVDVAAFFVPSSPIGGGGALVATIPDDDASSPARSNVCRITPVKSKPSTADVGHPMADDDRAASATGDGGGGGGGGRGGGRRRGRRGWAGVGFGRPISVVDEFDDAPRRRVRLGDDALAAAVVEEDEAGGEGEELSLDSCPLFRADDAGSIASISSGMTKRGRVDLARRLGRIESGLLEGAGETTREDAFRALASVARRQAKRVESLRRKADGQERKIGVLLALCEKLSTANRESAALRSSARAETDALLRENARLAEELRGSEVANAGLGARVAEMSERLRRMEEENVRVSRMLLDSYSSSADGDVGDPRGRSGRQTPHRRSEFDDLRDEYRRRAEGDRAEIERLGSEIARMKELHARREGRSERKVALLMEIKSAMEEQIRYLEGGGARTMSQYDDDSDAMGGGKRKNNAISLLSGLCLQAEEIIIIKYY